MRVPRGIFLALPAALRPAFDAEIERSSAALLPVLGPVAGAFVVLFGAWDAWMDPRHAALTLRIRVLLVLLGALSYKQGRLPWSPAWRCAWLYATHAGAVAICAAVMPQGLVLALPGLTGAMFMLALLEPRPPRFALAMAPPSALLALLAVLTLPRLLCLNTILLYLLSVPLALLVALAGLQLRRRAFLAEQSMLRAVRQDSLSGALSRGYVTELGMHDVALARRHARALAVAMLDIDWFKRVNDSFGHANGDRALCALVGACKDSLRASDYVGRLGGEEFVCVMPDSDPDHALACAERIRTRVAALCLATETGPLRFTVSIGVAALGPRHADWDDLLRAADAALYQAKAAGRNRTRLAQDGQPPPSPEQARAPAPGQGKHAG